MGNLSLPASSREFKSTAGSAGWAVGLLLVGLFVAVPAWAGDRAKDLNTYHDRLRSLVQSYIEHELELHRWCMARGFHEAGEAALSRARRLNEEAEPKDPSGTVDMKTALPAKILALRGTVSREYAALAKWCLGKKLLFEARRCVEKALLWDRRNSEARRLSASKKLKAKLLYETIVRGKQGVWVKGKWFDEADHRRSALPRVKSLCEEKKKAFGLGFNADVLPGVDVFYTVSAKTWQPVGTAARGYLAHVRGSFFLSSPRRPLQFYYLSDQAEFKKLGQNPAMMGAYEWGKGRLYAFPGFMGTGTIFHEMTHAMLETSFRSFPPLWMNEGLACFFEAYKEEEGRLVFGWSNFRDTWYRGALAKGKARSLDKLVKECAMMIDPLGYGQGRTLMLYLWSLGQLEAFVITAQLRDKGRLNFAGVLRDILGKPLTEAAADLEAFARTLAKAGQRVPRGQRMDDQIDGPMGRGPSVPEEGK